MKASLPLLLLLLSGSFSLSAQDVSARYGEDITAAALKKQLQVIAGPEMEGRETATPGQEKAAAYIAGQFKAAGLQPGAGDGQWEQFFPLYQDTLVKSHIRSGRKEYHFGKDFYTGMKDAHNEELLRLPLVYAGYGISNSEYDDYGKLDVHGKVVIVQMGIPQGYKPSGQESSVQGKLGTAAAKGAKALLVINPYADRMETATGRRRLKRSAIYLSKEPENTDPNLYYITPDMATALLGLPDKSTLPATALQAPSRVDIFFEKNVVVKRPSNVLAYLEGTDKKEEVVFVTAHYDHLGTNNGVIYYGADDDGSGTAAVICLAAAFARAKKEGHGPRRSMVFMTVSGEEKGLLGSRYYTEHPVYPLEHTVADLNIDMIGRIDPGHEKDTNYVYIIGDDKLSSDMRPISEKANQAYTGLQLDYKYNNPKDPERFYYRSDHYMFAKRNIPIIFYFNGTHADYHRSSDTEDKINYGLMTRRTRLVFHTAWEIANRELRLKVDRNEP